MFLQISRPEILEAQTSTTQENICRISYEWTLYYTATLSSHFLVNSKCCEASTWSQLTALKSKRSLSSLSPPSVFIREEDWILRVWSLLHSNMKISKLCQCFQFSRQLRLPRFKKGLANTSRLQWHKKTSNTQALCTSRLFPPDDFPGWRAQLIGLKCSILIEEFRLKIIQVSIMLVFSRGYPLYISIFSVFQMSRSES